MLALRDAGGFVAKYTQDVFEGLSPRMRRLMWALRVPEILTALFPEFWPVQTGSEVTLDPGEAAAKRFPGKGEE